MLFFHWRPPTLTRCRCLRRCLRPVLFYGRFFVYRQRLRRGLCAALLRLKKYKSKIFMRSTRDPPSTTSNQLPKRTDKSTDGQTDRQAVPFQFSTCLAPLTIPLSLPLSRSLLMRLLDFCTLCLAGPKMIDI